MADEGVWMGGEWRRVDFKFIFDWINDLRWSGCIYIVIIWKWNSYKFKNWVGLFGWFLPSNEGISGGGGMLPLLWVSSIYKFGVYNITQYMLKKINEKLRQRCPPHQYQTNCSGLCYNEWPTWIWGCWNRYPRNYHWCWWVWNLTLHRGRWPSNQRIDPQKQTPNQE